MKTQSTLLLLSAVLATGWLPATAAEMKATAMAVTVTFHESDKFTDARSSMGGFTDDYYLELIQKHLQQVAARQLASDQKLAITITDVDLAGDFIPGGRMGSQDVRIIKEVYIPRIRLSFKLLDAEGKVVKEGERTLSDMNFMNNIGLSGRNDPLFYDKALLTDWVKKEFKS